MGATHDGQGHVTLRFRLRPRADDDAWEVSVPISIEAGEELLSIVAAVESFFADAT